MFVFLSRKFVQRIVFSMLCLAGSALVNGQTTLLTFDELPFQSVNGLTFSDVSFGFTIDGSESPEAFYNSFGPGSLTYVSDPSLTGDASGELTLEFQAPVTEFEFGIAVNSAAPLTDAVKVDLLSIESTTSSTSFVDLMQNAGNLSFSESRFSYVGEPIDRAVISFPSLTGSFAFDNLTFTAVPEPSFGLAFGLSALVCTFTASRRNRKRAA